MGTVCSSQSPDSEIVDRQNPATAEKPRATVDPTIRREISRELQDNIPYKPSLQRGSQLPQIAEVRPPTPSSSNNFASTFTIPASVSTEYTAHTMQPYGNTEYSAQVMRRSIVPETVTEPADLLDRFDEKIRRLLKGKINVDLKPRMRSLHVHTIACPWDSDVEVDHLMKEVYPKLRHSYSRRGDSINFSCFNILERHEGFDLEFLDPCWGWTDEWYNNALSRQLCLKLTETCLDRQGDAICLYVVLLNDKVETNRLPYTIYQDDFDYLLNNVSGDDDSLLLNSAYSLDENAIPPIYKLQEKNLDEKKKENVLHLLRENLPPNLKDSYFCSAFSKQIRLLLNGPTEPDNILFFRRRFKNSPATFDDPECKFHFDVLNGVLDPMSDVELNDLANLIMKKMPDKQVIEGAIPWMENGLKGNGEGVIKYTNTFVQIYTNKVQEWVDAIISKIKEEEDQSTAIKMTERLYAEMQHHSTLCRSLGSEYTRTDDVVSSVHDYLASPAEYPLVITGPDGCGKSTLIASVVEKLHELPLWKHGGAIFRLCNTSVDCRTVDQLIHGIVQQLSLMFQKRPVLLTAEDYGRIVKELLTDAPYPLLVAVDGLDQIDPHHLITKWQWLPRRLPKNVWFILSVGQEAVPALKHHLPDACRYLTVPPLTTDDAMTVITQNLEAKSRTISEQQRLQIEQILDNFETTPLTAKILADIASVWDRDTSVALPSDPTELIKFYFKILEDKYGDIVKKAIYSFSKIHTGLSNQEGLNILSCHSDQLRDNSRYIPPILWYQICEDLRSHQRCVSARGTLTRRMSCTPLREVAMKMYYCQKYDDDLRLCFTHPALEYIIKECILDLTMDSCYQTHSLYRSHTEFTNIIFSGKYPDDMPNRLTEFNYIYYKIKGSDVFHVMSDIQKILLQDTEWNLAMLFSLLLESASALVLDSKLLAQQLILRAVNQEINELGLVQETLAQAHKWIGSHHSLISKRERYSVSLHVPAPQPNRDRTITSITNLKSDVDHMIGISQSRGELRLYNIRTGEVVRRITGLKDPVDMKSIDNEDVAVLCGRVIQVYNLDDGLHVSNMKGLLNTQTSSYGVYNQTHIVALSRNRLCVNLMEINTGDLGATFKAGESRFLESLFVGEDGHYCVCGDENEKPFPLLVWDLEKSQLIHDLRIPQSEFITSLAAITKSGQYFATVYRDISEVRTNKLVVYELETGKIHKKFSACHNTTALAISGESMNLVQALDDGRILVWSLHTGNCKCPCTLSYVFFNKEMMNKQTEFSFMYTDILCETFNSADDFHGQFLKYLRHVLRGHVEGPNRLLLSADGTRCLSYHSRGHDPSLRYWDIAEGTALGVYVPDCELVTSNVSLDGTVVSVSLRGLADPVLLCVDWSKVRSSGVPFGNPDKLGMEFDMKDVIHE